MTRRIGLAILLLSVGGLVSGCFTRQTPTPDYGFTLMPTHTDAAPAGTSVPSMTSQPPFTPVVGATPPAEGENTLEIATQAAFDILAGTLAISQDVILMPDPPLPTQWNDTSLGCPQPGEVYTQVIIPGYLFTLYVGDQVYKVHTDLSGNAVVCFNNGEMDDSDIALDPIVAEFIEQAKEDLAARLGVHPDQIVLVRSEAVEWSDGSLGCAEEGQDYTQVVTAGYRIVLAREEQHYEYHTDQHRIFLCPFPTE